jgi:hypothetical protein
MLDKPRDVLDGPTRVDEPRDGVLTGSREGVDGCKASRQRTR